MPHLNNKQFQLSKQRRTANQEKKYWKIDGQAMLDKLCTRHKSVCIFAYTYSIHQKTGNIEKIDHEDVRSDSHICISGIAHSPDTILQRACKTVSTRVEI